MKKNITSKIIMLLAAVIFCCSTGCSNIKNIRISSVRIASISVKGLRSVEADVAVQVQNPSKELNVSEFKGTIKDMSGKEIGIFNAVPLTIPARSDSEHTVHGTLELAQGFSPISFLSGYPAYRLENLKVDLNIKAGFGKNGIQKNFRFKDIPAESIIEHFKTTGK